jgi:hypothetical protein
MNTHFTQGDVRVRDQYGKQLLSDGKSYKLIEEVTDYPAMTNIPPEFQGGRNEIGIGSGVLTNGGLASDNFRVKYSNPTEITNFRTSDYQISFKQVLTVVDLRDKTKTYVVAYNIITHNRHGVTVTSCNSGCR